MKLIAVIDTEVDSDGKRILDFGGVRSDGISIHTKSISEFQKFLIGAEFIGGHNIIDHDWIFLKRAIQDSSLDHFNIVDTLYLSPLFFPSRPYHALVKDDKLQSEELNNPLNDSLKSRDLLYDEVSAFSQLDDDLKVIYYFLLSGKSHFSGFFSLISFKPDKQELEPLIRRRFSDWICNNADLRAIISENPVELAYCLSLINANSRFSITPPWILAKFERVSRIFFYLRGNRCITGCPYCNEALDIHKALKNFFGFSEFRLFDGEALQERAVQAAVSNKSIVAIFPTGGGKSLTFQLPALMSGDNEKGLTVVISPLQSLMKDQVDNLERAGITNAVTINGLLDPIERAKAIERVRDGSAALLYISPESLRSRTTEQLLLSRNVVRFVIDEAHCFSSWGQDFRVDYLYIGDFIKNLQEKKNLVDVIPVSCFTATAKQKVVEDIIEYFKEKLNLKLELFKSSSGRKNLQYKVFESGNDDEKYNALRDILDQKNCPTIIYVSRTRKAQLIAENLSRDGYNARAFHGKMESKEKTINQNAFIAGEVDIMVATSAFGMGVDKKDVGLVVHYEISDSLENYVQEAGRAGRNEDITADCYILFNEDDLGKHFLLLNQTKLSINEIKQIWKAVREITRTKNTVQKSALEIARKAGWDESLREIETRVTTAVAALEEAGYVKRMQNSPRVFANSILTKNAEEAIEKINASNKLDGQQKVNAVRIIKSLISSKNSKRGRSEEAESRVDYISDVLGIEIKEVITIINLLRAEKILADAKDLQVLIKLGKFKKGPLEITSFFLTLENYLSSIFTEAEQVFNLKELNELAHSRGIDDISIDGLKTIINFWSIKNWIKIKFNDYSKIHFVIKTNQPSEKLKEWIERRQSLAQFIINYLHTKAINMVDPLEKDKEEVVVDFSVLELQTAFSSQSSLFTFQASLPEIEDTLFFLARIEALKIEGGFLVVYNKLTIDRLERNQRVQYDKSDYQKLSQYYDHKVQQIHIVGEYAKKMMDDYSGALRFVEDYFQLNFSSFLRKYFPGAREAEIKRNISPRKYRQLFEELSDSQRKVIDDKTSKYIVVAAGPGSGKTKLLVHKLASLLLMEDVKHEQLLMLTFSRAAATEFKNRLIELIGGASAFVDIKTFHSFCFDILGRPGNLQSSKDVIERAINAIKEGKVESSKITKTVLVIDEAQDMDRSEFELVTTLIDRNEDLRVIAVGDDDQNIYEWRGSDSKYMIGLLSKEGSIKYELLKNYRANKNLVLFSNQLVCRINKRLKSAEIESHKQSIGIIRIFKYKSGDILSSLVKQIASSELQGTSCILTQRNDDALRITGLLNSHGIYSKLIQSYDGFNLYNMAEIRYFIECLDLEDESHLINDISWSDAKRAYIERYKNSSKFEFILNLIKDFESVNTKRKFRSDFEMFVKESSLEDFVRSTSEVIYVSTIHKAKGKEFDNVFLVLNALVSESDESLRQLYVALTRAKENLYIHTNSKVFEGISQGSIETFDLDGESNDSGLLMLSLNHRDLNLGYFHFVSSKLDHLIAGDALVPSLDGCKTDRGDLVLKFSRNFLIRLNELMAKGYKLREAKVDFVLYWNNDAVNQEHKIILPMLTLYK